jgi:chromosome segregation ATPase
MCPFGFVSNEKYLQLQHEKEKIEKSLEDVKRNVDEANRKIQRFTAENNALVKRNKFLEDRVVVAERERDELKIRVDTLTEERQLFQRLIGKLEARAKKQKKEGSASQSFSLNSKV